MLKILPNTSDLPLDELLEIASEATEPPSLPAGGIPRQWVPSWIRWPLRAIILPVILLDLAAQRFARLLIHPPFKQVGQCLKRGSCCHNILIPEPKGLLGRAFYIWSTQILGFYPRSRQVYESEEKKVLVMGCRYLKKDGSCRHYRLRPTACRKWPMIEYFGYPRTLKGCGFKAVLRDQSSSSQDN